MLPSVDFSVPGSLRDSIIVPGCGAHVDLNSLVLLLLQEVLSNSTEPHAPSLPFSESAGMPSPPDITLPLRPSELPRETSCIYGSARLARHVTGSTGDGSTASIDGECLAHGQRIAKRDDVQPRGNREPEHQ